MEALWGSYATTPPACPWAADGLVKATGIPWFLNQNCWDLETDVHLQKSGFIGGYFFPSVACPCVETLMMVRLMGPGLYRISLGSAGNLLYVPCHRDPYRLGCQSHTSLQQTAGMTGMLDILKLPKQGSKWKALSWLWFPPSKNHQW